MRHHDTRTTAEIRQTTSRIYHGADIIAAIRRARRLGPCGFAEYAAAPDGSDEHGYWSALSPVPLRECPHVECDIQRTRHGYAGCCETDPA